MKKQTLKLLLAVIIFFSASNFTQAQTRIYVKVRPATTVVVRPLAPRRNYVWVDDEWTVRHGAYERVPGRWVAPRRGFIGFPAIG